MVFPVFLHSEASDVLLVCINVPNLHYNPRFIAETVAVRNNHASGLFLQARRFHTQYKDCVVKGKFAWYPDTVLS